MADELTEPTESMAQVMSLAGDVGALARCYAEWAETYDDDVTSHGYALPDMMVTTLSRTAELSPDAGIRPTTSDASAGLVLIAGVFTVGHIPPEALATVSELCRPGGFLIASTRQAYHESTDYQAASDRLVADGVLELVLRVDDGPYTMDSTAHYWSYRVVWEEGG